MPRAGARITLVSGAVPGRARLQVRGLRGREDIARAIQDRLLAFPDVHRVYANPITGNVLVLFEPRRLRLRDLIGSLRRLWRQPSRSVRRARGGPSVPLWAEDRAYHLLPRTAVIRCLDGSPTTGLSREEAARRLAEAGPNIVPAHARRPLGRIILEQVTSLPVLLLGAAAALSLATGGLFDAVVILAVVVLNTAIAAAMESRAERALASLATLASPRATVRRGGHEHQLPAAELVPGDLLVLGAGCQVPADARLLTVERLVANESMLTGESQPVAKSTARATSRVTAIADRTNMVYAGTMIAEGAGLAMVTATGRRTEVGKIRALVGEAAPPPTPLARELDRMGRRLVALCLGLSGVILTLGLLRGVPVLEMLTTAIALAVAAVPEGLPTVATTTLVLGMQHMRRRGALIRKLEVVENLGAVTVVCVDKTGTITENRMAVEEWYLGRHRVSPSVALPGIAPTPLLRRALEIGVLCNDAELDPPAADRPAGASGSPTERALLAAARDAGLDYRQARAAYPRQALRQRSDRQYWMGTVHQAGSGGRLVAVKGAPEVVLQLSAHWHDGRRARRLTKTAKRHIVEANAGMARRGMRVLGLAYKKLDPPDAEAFEKLTWAGLVGLADPVRPGVRESVAACQRAGIRIVMLTGDQPLTALALARNLRVRRTGKVQVLDASRLDGVKSLTLARHVRKVDVFARISPRHKYDIVRALQQAGDVVAMTGDGINDAPALRVADVGIAMGVAGTTVARDVADVVLTDDNFAAILEAIAQGRTIRANITKSLRFLLSTNLSEVLVMAAAMAGGVARPLSAIQLLWINLLSDVLSALALAVERPERTVMIEPPQDPAAPVLSPAVLRQTARDAAWLSVATLMAYGAALARDGVGPRSSTVAFSTLTGAQLLHTLGCRSEQRSAFHEPGQNPFALAAVGGGLALQAATVTTPLGQVLGTVPLAGREWGIVATGAILPLLASELSKGFAETRVP